MRKNHSAAAFLTTRRVAAYQCDWQLNDRGE
jgi:hypothetical protein